MDMIVSGIKVPLRPLCECIAYGEMIPCMAIALSLSSLNS